MHQFHLTAVTFQVTSHLQGILKVNLPRRSVIDDTYSLRTLEEAFLKPLEEFTPGELFWACVGDVVTAAGPVFAASLCEECCDQWADFDVIEDAEDYEAIERSIEMDLLKVVYDDLNPLTPLTHEHWAGWIANHCYEQWCDDPEFILTTKGC